MIGDLPTNTKRDRKASEGALPQGEGWSRATVSSRDTSLHWSSTVCLEVKPVGEPDAGNPHVRFDERGEETERCRMAQATAPLLDYLIGSEKCPFFEHSQPRADDGHLVVRVPGLRLIDGLRLAHLPP